MEIPKKKNVIVTYVALFKVFKVTAFWKECPVFFLQFCTIYFIFKKDKKVIVNPILSVIGSIWRTA